MPNRPIDLSYQKYLDRGKQGRVEERLAHEWVIEQGAMHYVAVHRALCALNACGEFSSVESFIAYVSSRWGNPLGQTLSSCAWENTQKGEMGHEK